MAYASSSPHLDLTNAAGPSSVPFPRGSELSLLVGGEGDFHARPRLESWRRASALEVHDLVYGSYYSSNGGDPVDGDAEKAQQEFRERIERLYETDAVYENPLLTADSRTLILYLYALTHKLSSLGVPRLRLSSFLPFLSHDHPKPFPLLHVWCEVIETCESESFDGARMAMLEQTLHILFLPEWHTSTGRPSSTNSLVHHPGDSGSTVSLLSTAAALGQAMAPPPKLKLPWPFGGKGEDTGLSSPFHFQLHVITRLQFNEGGRIAMHRDFWDVRDLTEALFSFSTLFGWFARRLIAYNLIAFAWIFSLVPSFPRRASTSVPPHSFSHSAIPTPRARTRTSTYTGAGGAVSPILRTTTSFTREQEGILSAGLGLSFGAGARNMQVGDGAGQAPDTDRDSMS